VGENKSRLCGSLVEVAREPLRLVCFVRSEIVRPAEADGLILQLCCDVKGAAGGGDFVVRDGAAANERWVVKRLSSDGDVGRGGAFVETRGKDAIVFEVVGGGQQSGCHVVLRVTEDGLEDLDLIGCGNRGVVRLEADRIGVIEVARDGAVRVEMTRLKDHMTGSICNRDVKPRAARRESGGKLVASEILHGDSE